MSANQPNQPQYETFFSAPIRKRAGRQPAARSTPVKPRPDNIPLAFGYPFDASFATAELAKATEEMLAAEGTKALQYGGGAGVAALRDYLLERARARGVEAGPENFLMTYGSSQGLDLMARCLADPGDLIITEAPTFFGGLRTFQMQQVEVKGAAVDRDGMNMDELEMLLVSSKAAGRKPKFVYVIPNFQNPTGTTMSLERRQRLLELADAYDFLILEDDAYVELRYEGESLPSIKSLDRSGRVVYAGTFSKIVAPGVRLGWLIGPAPIIAALSSTKTDGATGPFAASVVNQYCRDGDLDARIAWLRQEYKHRRDAMLGALEGNFPAGTGVRWSWPQGGFFVWLELPPHVDSREIYPAALANGVTYVDGPVCFPDGSGKNYMRLCFSYCSDDELREGIRRLADVIKEKL